MTITYHKHFALFHIRFRETLKSVGILSISAEPREPLVYENLVG